MQKNVPIYAVSLFLIAACMSAGCAKQDVIRKDEGIAPAPAARQVDSPPKAITAPPEQAIINTSPQVVPAAPAQTGLKSASSGQLHSSLDKIYFNFDSAGLSEAARSTLTKNAAILATKPTTKIRIEGNCDARGSSEYNLALGERRAKAAYQYLVTLGVNPVRLSTISYGNEKPAVQGNDEASWAKNRIDQFAVITP